MDARRLFCRATRLVVSLDMNTGRHLVWVMAQRELAIGLLDLGLGSGMGQL